MERLTKLTKFGTVIVMGCKTIFSPTERKGACLRNAIARLYQYENTGLIPDEVTELAETKRDGRLLVLPCKLGETVYKVINFAVTSTELLGIQPMSGWDVVPVQFGLNMLDEIGKTIFITSAEAEKTRDEHAGH